MNQTPNNSIKCSVSNCAHHCGGLRPDCGCIADLLFRDCLIFATEHEASDPFRAGGFLYAGKIFTSEEAKTSCHVVHLTLS